MKRPIIIILAESPTIDRLNFLHVTFYKTGIHQVIKSLDFLDNFINILIHYFLPFSTICATIASYLIIKREYHVFFIYQTDSKSTNYV